MSVFDTKGSLSVNKVYVGYECDRFSSCSVITPRLKKTLL